MQLGLRLLRRAMMAADCSFCVHQRSGRPQAVAHWRLVRWTHVVSSGACGRRAVVWVWVSEAAAAATAADGEDAWQARAEGSDVAAVTAVAVAAAGIRTRASEGGEITELF